MAEVVVQQRSTRSALVGRQAGVTHTLEELHATFVGAGARRAGLSNCSKTAGQRDATPPPALDQLSKQSRRHSHHHHVSRPTPQGGSKAPSDADVNVRAAKPGTAASKASCTSVWVWGQEPAASTTGAMMGRKQQQHTEEDVTADGRDDDRACVTAVSSGDGGGAPAAKAASVAERKQMFADVTSSSSCSTVDMTASESGSNKANSPTLPLDDSFWNQLSEFSVRFPEPPTRAPNPAPSNSSALTISGWGKNITSTLPSVQGLLPPRWRKRLRTAGAHKRCRKSTSRWIARSKATTSMSENSVFARAVSISDGTSHHQRHRREKDMGVTVASVVAAAAAAAVVAVSHESAPAAICHDEQPAAPGAEAVAEEEEKPATAEVEVAAEVSEKSAPVLVKVSEDKEEDDDEEEEQQLQQQQEQRQQQQLERQQQLEQQQKQLELQQQHLEQQLQQLEQQQQQLEQQQQQQQQQLQPRQEDRPVPSALPTPAPVQPAPSTPPPAPLWTAPRPPLSRQETPRAARYPLRRTARYFGSASSHGSARERENRTSPSPYMSTSRMMLKNRLASSGSSIFEEDGDDSKKTKWLNPYTLSPAAPGAAPAAATAAAAACAAPRAPNAGHGAAAPAAASAAAPSPSSPAWVWGGRSPRTSHPNAAAAATSTARQQQQQQQQPSVFVTGASWGRRRRDAAVRALNIKINRRDAMIYGDQRRRVRNGESGIWLPSPGIWSSGRKPTPLSSDLLNPW